MSDRSSALAVAVSVVGASCSLAHDLDGLQGGGGVAGASAAGGSAGTGGLGESLPCAEGAQVGVCPGGQKCTLAVPGQGVAGGLVCGPSGSTAAWSSCTTDGDCGDGLWCEEATGVCKPWCSDASTCPDGAACVAARRADGTAVAGWTTCTAHCRPDNPAARCGSDATCIMITVDDGSGPRSEGDCAKSGGEKAGCLCQVSADCAPGLLCDPSDLRCHAWCEAGGLCAGGSSCGPSQLTYDGTGFGQCIAQMCFNN